MMMSGGMPPTAGGMGVMGVMGGYLGGGREYLESGSVGVDSSVWVPPFWDDPHLADAHLHDPSIAEAAHMGEPPTMSDVSGGDLMDAFPPHHQHGKNASPKRFTSFLAAFVSFMFAPPPLSRASFIFIFFIITVLSSKSPFRHPPFSP